MLSVVAFGIGFGWLGVHTANKWEIAAGMYIVGRKCNFVRQTVVFCESVAPLHPSFMILAIRGEGEPRTPSWTYSFASSLDVSKTIRNGGQANIEGIQYQSYTMTGHCYHEYASPCRCKSSLPVGSKPPTHRNPTSKDRQSCKPIAMDF